LIHQFHLFSFSLYLAVVGFSGRPVEAAPASEAVHFSSPILALYEVVATPASEAVHFSSPILALYEVVADLLVDGVRPPLICDALLEFYVVSNAVGWGYDMVHLTTNFGFFSPVPGSPA
jgi:hypothetical protein